MRLRNNTKGIVRWCSYVTCYAYNHGGGILWTEENANQSSSSEWMYGCVFYNNSASLGHDVCFDWNSTISDNVFDSYSYTLSDQSNRVNRYYYSSGYKSVTIVIL